MKRQESDNRPGQAKRTAMADRRPSFSLSATDIMVDRVQPEAQLQIHSDVRSGGRTYKQCEEDGGFWQCSGEAVSCYCVDSGTGDWD